MIIYYNKIKYDILIKWEIFIYYNSDNSIISEFLLINTYLK